MTIEEKVLKAISQFNMIDKGDRVLAAVSGGADSVCMLHVLNRLKKSLGFELFCAHLNHGLRGDAADNDEKFVVDLCQRLDIKAFTKKVDVGAFAHEKKLTVEEAGRVVRYDFFEELSKKHHFNKVATAHNKNDNAETVLMRIIRGTGIDGLSGVPHMREGGVIRPILDISRTEIEEYCRENGLDFCTDATNADNDYTRNKIRNQLIPYLEKEFNPEVSDALVRLAENAAEDSEFLNGYAKRLYSRLGNPLPSKRPAALHIDSLKMLEKSVAIRLIKLAAQDSASGVKLSKKHIEDIFKLIDKGTGTKIDLPCSLKAEVSYGWLIFRTTDGNSALADDKFFLEIAAGQSVFVQSVGKEITLKIENAAEYKCALNEIAADFDKIGTQPLFLRNRRDGDRIVWFADGRTKKIKSVFIDEKIPKNDRDKIPLLCTGDEVVAIVGSRASEKYKVTKDTERALVIVYGTVEK
ncbi:MAG: tRNA lysidine(34) synthetase TilS [Clostridia bacterium]|nr:tRNA lysidine(34) synthetase TilS [Clostridia bacterium]